MSAAERSDLDVDADLAAGFCRELALRIDEMKGTLAAWHAARDAAAAARDAVEPAKKRAWAAQLGDAADAGELTRRFEEARHEAGRARRELTAATEQVRDAVGNAESDVIRMRSVTLSGDAASRVERMANVTMEHAWTARDEARLGPSPEDAAHRRSDEWVAAQRVAAPVGAPPTGVATSVTKTNPRDEPESNERPSTAFPKKDWRSLSNEERAHRIQHALALIEEAASKYRDPPSWRDLARETGISARKLRMIKKLVEEHTEAERSAAQRQEQSLHRHAVEKHLAV